MFQKSLLFIFGFFAAISLQAQKINLTKEQMLKGAPHQVTKPLPYFLMWEDAENFIVAKKENSFSSYKKYRINVKTDNCVKELYANQDLYLKKKPSIWSFKDNKHGVSIKELFKK